jgi:hypothetical protein
VLFSVVTLEADDMPGRAGRPRAALPAVGRVLSGHPEARSLLSEAGHRRVLFEQSAAAAGLAAAAADAARLRYEELRHLLDPRAQRPLPCWAALPLLAAVSAGLAALAWLELAVLPGRAVAAAAVAAVAAVAAAWLAGAWLAATAGREGHAVRTAAAWAAAAAFAALLAALHATAAPGWNGGLPGALWAALSSAGAVAAACLISRTEPRALARARGHWRRAEARRAAAARTSLADAQSAAIARQSWLGLVRSTVAAQGGEQAGEQAGEQGGAQAGEQLTCDAVQVAAQMI